MNVLYCAYGTPGLSILDELMRTLNSDDKILCITYKHPDNRDLLKKLEFYNIDYSTKNINNKSLKNKIESFSPNLIVSIFFRDLIGKYFLDLSEMGGINLHPSLLPKYRGAFSCPWAIIKGEKKTGITYHYMNERFDDGNIIFQKAIKIINSDTAFTVYNKLIGLASENFRLVYNLVVTKRFKGFKQKGQVSYYKRKLPYNGFIDIKWPIEKIDCFIRAMIFPNKTPAKLILGEKQYEIENLEQFLKLTKK